MASKTGRTSEYEMSIVVMKFLEQQPHGEATQQEIKDSITDSGALKEDDKEGSPTRPREQLCDQIRRNIVSHRNNPTNFINCGYMEHMPDGRLRITGKGRRFMKSLANPSD